MGRLCMDDNLDAGFLTVEGWRKSRVENIEKVADYVGRHRKRAIVDRWKVIRRRRNAKG